jgi:tRNA nucleotidyltransferase/poly(A) polymerase
MQVLSALKRKIARERVGTEVAGCLQGPHPVLAARHFEALRTFPAVFQPPDATAERLGGGFGAPCVRALELAHPLLVSQEQQVLPRHVVLNKRRDTTPACSPHLPCDWSGDMYRVAHCM